MKDKILTLPEMAACARQLSSQGKQLVATNGCFDILHVGHVRYLEAARRLGDALVVGLNGDDSVRALKGKGRPINNENDRAEVLAALDCVGFVVIFQEPRATRFLQAVCPSIYVKGGDYMAETLNEEERRALEQAGTRIELIPFEPGYSTSGLLKRIRQNAET